MNELDFNRINSEKISSLLCGQGTLTYNEAMNEELDRQQKVSSAVNYLEGLGIKVRTEYGYYRNTYDVLRDLGEYLSKNNNLYF